MKRKMSVSVTSRRKEVSRLALFFFYGTYPNPLNNHTNISSCAHLTTPTPSTMHEQDFTRERKDDMLKSFRNIDPKLHPFGESRASVPCRWCSRSPARSFAA
jgi:hypothetical protein